MPSSKWQYEFTHLHALSQGLDSAAAALAANASAPTACPWHQFWESAAHPAAWHAIASVARQHAADNLMYTTAVTAVVVPVLGMMCQKQGRRLLFQVMMPCLTYRAGVDCCLRQHFACRRSLSS